MPDANDMDLVREFARTNSEAAFTELVRRHINLVYSVALRQVGDPHQAEEITQAVFIILARKAAGLGEKTLLTGWLYETTRFTAARLLRTNARRHAREQEAHMQSILNESSDDIWRQIAPLLDTAVAGLNEKDRRAIVLRFYEGRNLNEVGVALGANEDAAKKRVTRAVEKLRKIFIKRGVTLTATAIAGAVSANSVQAAPVGLVKAVTAIAIVKGAAATASTLTLVKGALKIMAWSKTKTAIVTAAVVLLAASTTMIAIKKYDAWKYAWELPPFPQYSDEKLWKAPPQVSIVPSKYRDGMYGTTEGGLDTSVDANGVTQTKTNGWKSIGVGETLESIVRTAYGREDFFLEPWQTVYATKIPDKPLYDYLSNLPNSTREPLQELIKKKFGIVAHWEMLETNVIIVKYSNPEIQGLAPAGSLLQSMNMVPTNSGKRMAYNNGWLQKDITDKNGHTIGTTYFNVPVEHVWKQNSLEYVFQRPIVDETGLTNNYDFTVTPPQWNTKWNDRSEVAQEAWHDALLKQFGLELIPTNRVIQMLVVERTP